MGKLSSKLRSIGDDTYGHAIGFYCPGCKDLHVLYHTQGTSQIGPVWTWDGNVDKPTVSPSVRLFRRDRKGFEITACHFFLKSGYIEYCNDCDHSLSGKTVELPDWPYAEGDFGGV